MPDGHRIANPHEILKTESGLMFVQKIGPRHKEEDMVWRLCLVAEPTLNQKAKFYQAYLPESLDLQVRDGIRFVRFSNAHGFLAIPVYQNTRNGRIAQHRYRVLRYNTILFHLLRLAWTGLIGFAAPVLSWAALSFGGLSSWVPASIAQVLSAQGWLVAAGSVGATMTVALFTWATRNDVDFYWIHVNRLKQMESNMSKICQWAAPVVRKSLWHVGMSARVIHDNFHHLENSYQDHRSGQMVSNGTL